MNGKNLMKGLGYISRKFIDEAENDTACKVYHRNPLKKTVLLAAIISLLVMLAGCVAVFLGLQERKIGEKDNLKKFDAYGETLAPTEGRVDLVSMSGIAGSPGWSASKDWYEFIENYDPGELTNHPDHPDIPNNYEHTYGCYDQTMVDKLDEIAGKYDLKLLGHRAGLQRWHREAAFEELGISGFIREDAEADSSYGVGMLYPPFDFKYEAFLTLTGRDGAWSEEVMATLYYLKADYLSPNGVFSYDPINSQQWTYTAADGAELILILEGKDGLIVAPREDATIVIQLQLFWQGIFMEEDMPLPTRADIEQLADCFDYSITTREMSMTGLQEKINDIPDPHAVDPDNIPVPEEVVCNSYGEFFVRNQERGDLQYPEFIRYAYYDVDKDGQEDLILTYEDGETVLWLTMRDGSVQVIGSFIETRLLEDGLVENMIMTDAGYLHLMKITGTKADGSIKTDTVRFIQYNPINGWQIDHNPATREEAMAAMEDSRKDPIDLPWKPLTEFPMENGETFADTLAREKQPQGEELIRFYAENGPKDADWDEAVQFYALRDLNSDGVEELLLSRDGEIIDLAYTVRRGRLQYYSGGFQLCKDSTEMHIDDYHSMVSGKCKRYSFWTQYGDQIFFDGKWLWNEQTGRWYNDMLEELPAGTDILARYPREKLEMRPIQKLVNNR